MSKRAVLGRADWAAIWRAFDKWATPNPDERVRLPSDRKIQALVNARLRERVPDEPR